MIFPNVYPRIQNISLSFEPIYSIKNKISNSILEVFSAKQTVRPDSFLTCCLDVIPYVKHSIAVKCWNICFIARRIINKEPEKEFKQCLEALKLLNRILDEANLEDIVLSTNEKELLSGFLARAASQSSYLNQLNHYLIFINEKEANLLKAFQLCKDLTKLIFEDSVDSLLKKIDKIQDCLNLHMDETSFPEEFKIRPKDLRLLAIASREKLALEKLRKVQISFPLAEELYSKVSKLKNAHESPTIEHLKRLCSHLCIEGRVPILNRLSLFEMRDLPFDFEQSMLHLGVGKLVHTGIFVNQSEGMSISHVNMESGGHDIETLIHPLFYGFANILELDISPLLPQSVSVEHRKQLQETFSRAFKRLASEEHKDIPLARTARYLLMFFLGHKSPFSHDLSTVKLTPQHPELCSSYVGIVFLMAIKEVNVQLLELGYKEIIPHPFGDHEVVDRVDMLRLLYHWKRLKVCKIVPPDPVIAKVMSLPIL